MTVCAHVCMPKLCGCPLPAPFLLLALLLPAGKRKACSGGGLATTMNTALGLDLGTG